MTTNLFLAFTGFAACLLLTPLVWAVAERFGWYDLPGALKIHSKPVPRLGGVALMGGILAATAVAPKDWRLPVAVLAILLVVWVTGVMDDLKSTPALLRLAVDFGCGAALWSAGWRLGWFSSSFLDLWATVLFVALTINAMNLLDGMDGLALVVASLGALGFIVLFGAQTRSAGAGLAWTLLAVCLAMLIFNFPPARLYIGDGGSTLLGAALALLALNWVRTEPATHSVAVPAAFFALPLADLLAAVIRRLRGRQSPFVGDRRHFYDLLLRRGWSVPQILAASGSLTTFLIVLFLAVGSGAVDFWLALGTTAGLLAAAGALLGSFTPEPPVAETVAPAAFKPTLSEDY